MPHRRRLAHVLGLLCVLVCAACGGGAPRAQQSDLLSIRQPTPDPTLDAVVRDLPRQLAGIAPTATPTSAPVVVVQKPAAPKTVATAAPAAPKPVATAAPTVPPKPALSDPPTRPTVRPTPKPALPAASPTPTSRSR